MIERTTKKLCKFFSQIQNNIFLLLYCVAKIHLMIREFYVLSKSLYFNHCFYFAFSFLINIEGDLKSQVKMTTSPDGRI